MNSTFTRPTHDLNVFALVEKCGRVLTQSWATEEKTMEHGNTRNTGKI